MFKLPKDDDKACFSESLGLNDVLLLLEKFFFLFLLFGSGLYSESVELADSDSEFAGESSDSELVLSIARAFFFVARCCGFEIVLDASELVSAT